MTTDQKAETDIIVIGAGLGGLCCGALLARYGYRVKIFEAHCVPGGAAHSFARSGYHFDAGPSFHAGLAMKKSINPLKQVLDLLGEELPCITYKSWSCHFPEGPFTCTADSQSYAAEISRFAGSEAAVQWQRLEKRLEKLAAGVSALPAAIIRTDAAMAYPLLKNAGKLLKMAPMAHLYQQPFSRIVDSEVTHPFLRNLMDLESFVLSGLKADSTIAAEMAFMYRERHRSTIDYPLGGSKAIADALVRGLEKFGGELYLNTPVEFILTDTCKACGVGLKNGREITAAKAVVSNVSIWDTLELLPAGSIPEGYRQKSAATPMTDSFMHLHLGIDASGLENLECHHLVVNSWKVDEPQNVCIISIPSVFDPRLSPAGKHTVHAYTAGNEPYSLWENVPRGSERYKEMKNERSQVLWQALEKVIPDIRQRVEVSMMGSPLTQERYLNRRRGTYGAGFRAGREHFPGPRTPLKNLYCCGDSRMPGIGVPSVAASGMMTANTIAPLRKHLQLIKDLKAITG